MTAGPAGPAGAAGAGDLPPLDENPSLLDIARRALASAESLGARADRDPLAAVINNTAAYQRTYLDLAGTYAAVSTAESMERIAVVLERIAKNQL